MTQLLKDIRVRVAVIDSPDPKARKPNRSITRNAARCLVNRQTYFFVSKAKTCIKRCRSHIGQPSPKLSPKNYQHHIEPKLVPLCWENSAFQRYLEGYSA